MRIQDGKLDILSIKTFLVFEEFGWNMEEMASVIIDLRKEIEEMKKYYNKEINKLEEILGK